jgi:hypothetical protein
MANKEQKHSGSREARKPKKNKGKAAAGSKKK